MQKEHNCTKTIVLDSAVETRWNSEHEYNSPANINQQDFHIALDRMISSNGVDKDLYQANRNNIAKVEPTKENWLLYQQYEGAAQALRQYSKFIQSAKAVVHLEIFEAKMELERLSASYFVMNKKLSADDGP